MKDIMILIFSNYFDQSTNDVIDWISYKSVSFKRVNSKDIYFGGDVKTIRLGTNSNYSLLDKEKITSIWLRRWYDLFNGSDIVNDNYTKIDLSKEIVKKSIKEEFERLSYYTFTTLFNKPWLTYPDKLWVNKLVVLEYAKEIGLDIPTTLITKSIEQLIDFKKEFSRIIAKPISESRSIPFNDTYYSNLTIEITDEMIAEAEKFPVSLFQEFLDKEFEIRVFYLDGVCYSMAIFSQNDPKTRIDFRAYNHEKPNRRVPYKLDESLIISIGKLMSKLGLQTGSLDFVKTKDNRMVFLEVNPVGQFGMISYPCNYFIEDKIANYLIKISKNDI